MFFWIFEIETRGERSGEYDEETKDKEGNENVLYIPWVACVIYATPRYRARKRMQIGRVIHGAGGEFEHRISKSEKTVLRMWTDMLDHAG